MANRQMTKEQPTARVGWNNRVRTVSIPAGFRFPDAVKEVYIRGEDDSVILTPRPADGSGIVASDAKASADFMAEVERLAVQDRSF